MSLCPLRSSTVHSLSLSPTHCNYCLLVVCHCVQYSLLQSVHFSVSTSHCILLVLCHSVHCCLLQSVHCLSVPHTEPFVLSASICPLLSSIVCPLSVSTSQCAVFWFGVTLSTVVFYSLYTVCKYLTLYCLLVLCHSVHCCLLQSVHCL